MGSWCPSVYVFVTGTRAEMALTRPIAKPSVPFNTTLSLHLEQQIHVIGKPSKHPGDFEINFKAGGDVAFHFNVRFAGSRYGHISKVVRDYCRGGQWLHCEEGGSFPFALARQFELVFRVESGGFRVAVDGNESFFYAHQMPWHSVNGLEIKGDLKLKQVSLGQPGFAPAGGVGFTPPPPVAAPVYNAPAMSSAPPMHMGGRGLHFAHPPLPFHHHVSLRIGSRLHLHGQLPHGAKSFAVNFMAGSDIALHLNPRLTEGAVVRNACRGGSWGGEERGGGMPFRTGQPFDLLIQVDHASYMVAVNNQHFASFNHRLPKETVSGVEVKGDLSLSLLTFD